MTRMRTPTTSRSSQQRAVALPVIMAQAQAISGHDTSARLSELTMPTLVIHGTADEILPVAERPPGRIAHTRLAP